MAETRHLAGRPCVLTTAEAAELRDVGSAAEAEGLAWRLRARWVAEALEEIVQVSVLTGGDLQSFTSGQKCMIRRRAAEYRDGRR